MRDISAEHDSAIDKFGPGNIMVHLQAGRSNTAAQQQRNRKCYPSTFKHLIDKSKIQELFMRGLGIRDQKTVAEGLKVSFQKTVKIDVQETDNVIPRTNAEFHSDTFHTILKA
jgi:hypothetical protein